MWNIYGKCGRYRPDKIIDPNGPAAICPECGYRHPFRQLPLLLVTGASAAGKSNVCRTLLGRVSRAVLLDADFLWLPEFDTPQDNYRAFTETWLRMCKNIGQSGRPVVLFGAGTGVPHNLEPCVERRYFSDLHYLALTCDDDVQVQRLEQRRVAGMPSHSPEFIAAQVQFNRWFKTQGAQPGSVIGLLDTTSVPLDVTAGQVLAWIRTKIAVR